MKAIDLEQAFPGYRIAYEDTQFQLSRDPWHKTIECRHGHICPAGGSKLWACTKSRKCTAARTFLADKSSYVIKMDGDDGINVEFDVSQWQTFFKIMGAKKR